MSAFAPAHSPFEESPAVREAAALAAQIGRRRPLGRGAP